jgi:hypothetical protein
LARAALAAARLVRRGNESPAVELYYVGTLPAVIELACGILLTSPTPDFAVHVLGFVLCGELLAFVSDDPPSQARCLALVFLSSAAVTAKPSIAVLAVATISVAVAWWWRRTRPERRVLTRTIGLAAMLASVPAATWIARNVITSGCPLYPSSLGALPIEWRTHNDAIAWINAPMNLPLENLVHDPRWTYERLLTLGWADPEFREPMLLLGLMLILVPLARGIRARQHRSDDVTPAILIPPALSFVFVFVSTPMPKYQGAVLWVLPITLAIVGLPGVRAHANRLVRVAWVSLIVAAATQALFRREPLLLPLTDFQPVGETEVAARELPSGLSIYVPVIADFCGNGPLPCTPEPHPGLRLRRPGDLGSGFVVDVDLEDPGSRP